MEGDSKANSSDPYQKLISRMRVSNLDSEVKKDIVETLLEEWLSSVSNEEWILGALDLLQQELHPSEEEGSLITTTSSSAAAFINSKRHVINNLNLYFYQTRMNNNAPSSPPHTASPLEIPNDTQLHSHNPNAINLEEMYPSTNKIDDLVEMDSSTSKVDPQEMDSSTNKIDSVPSHEVPNHTTFAPTKVPNDPTSAPTEVPNEPTSAPTNVNHPSAHSLQSNDSIEELLGGKSNSARRFNLPSPKRKTFSALKSYEMPKIAKRRKVKKWSRLEEQTLKTAIRIYGEGNWKSMLDSYPDVFDERTTGDLKDKWRNMNLQRSK